MKCKGARSRMKKRAVSSYLFHSFYRTLSAAIMAALLPPKKRKRASSRLNNRLLPSELIEEILLNLPHKSLVRFSAVSKSWNSMIFDPVFARKHKNRATLLSRSHRLVLFFMDEFDEAGAVFSLAPISSDLRIKVIKKKDKSGDESDPSFSVFSNAKDDVVTDFVGQFKRKPYLLAYCDELWCVQVEQTLFLWNPSMRNIVKLPPPSSPLKNCDDFLYGLAYDSVNDDYKILKVGWHSPSTTELYSMKNNCWREIESVSSDFTPSGLQKRCEFVDGRFHWIGLAPIIVSFDLSTEKYGEVVLPHEYDDVEEDCDEYDDVEEDCDEVDEVVTLNGKLCAYANYEDYDKEETRFVLWVMEEYGVENSWTKRFDIMLTHPSILGYSCSSPDTLRPLYLSDNNDLAVTIWGHCTNDVYILMYRNGEASRPLKIVKHQDYKADAFLYVESLITIDKFSEKI